jgi:hypothetical protein
MILIGIHSAAFVGLYLFMRRSIGIPVAWKSIGKYILAALLMGVVLFLLPTTTTLLTTLGKTIGGFALYVVLLLIIDKQARELVGLIWEEIKGSLTLFIKGNDNSSQNGSVATEN